MSGGDDRRDRRERKGLANEILPDPSQAEQDLAAGGPRGRTVEHLKRILAAATLAFAAEGCTTPSGGAPEKKGSDPGSQGGGPPTPPPPPRLPEPAGYGVVDPLPDPSYERNLEKRRKHKKKSGGGNKGE